MDFDVTSFSQNLPYKLDQFQIDACEKILNGESVLVCAPTSSGKTTVASFSQHLALKKDYKCFYTTPIKALSNQIYNDCVQEFGKEAVGLLTGDRSINTNAKLLVMTTEVLRNMIYAKSDLLTDLKYVILDEVHYLQDASRGAVWEEVIVHLPLEVQLICLSATISNYHEVSNWLERVRGNCSVVYHDVRPVPLNKYFFYAQKHRDPEIANVSKKSSIPKLVKYLNKKRYYLRSPQINELVDLLLDEGKIPAIFFIFSRKQCNELAYSTQKSFKSFVTKDERAQLIELADQATNSLCENDIIALELDIWRKAFTNGVSPHHAGLIPQVRVAVENGIKRGLIKIVFATETLALGLNMPTKAVVLYRFTKYNGTDHSSLSSSEVAQLSGRAGRRGTDVEGDLIVNWNHNVETQEVLATMSSNVFQLRSAFKPTYNMALNLLKLHSPKEIERLLGKSFAQHGNKKDVKDLTAQLHRIEAQLDASKKRKRDYLVKKQAKIINKLKEKKLTLSTQFLNIVNLLIKRGFLDNINNQIKITSKGTILTGLSTEADLLISEVLDSGALDNVSPNNLCIAISWISHNSRGDSSGEPPTIWPNDDLFDLYLKFSEIAVEISKDERRYNVAASRGLDFGLTYPVHKWSQGKALHEIINNELMGGDFIKNILHIVDILNHVSSIYPPLRTTIIKSKELLIKDLIQEIINE